MTTLPAITLTLADLETLVVNRLVICLGEVSGVKDVADGPPMGEIGINRIPLAYPEVGPMLGAIPATAAGRFVVSRTYSIVILGRQVEGDTVKSDSTGASGYTEMRKMIAPVREYFMLHPNLQTSTLDALNGIKEQLTLTDTGVIQEQGRWAVRFDFIISMSARVNTLG